MVQRSPPRWPPDCRYHPGGSWRDLAPLGTLHSEHTRADEPPNQAAGLSSDARFEEGRPPFADRSRFMIAATGRTRDEFKKDVKQIIADRVGGLCSNPACRRPTKGSHTDDERVLNLGEACHIRAAAEGGPRYDSAQSSDDRKSAPNGIWLCSSCSTLVDADEQAYPTDLLLKWKEDAEHDARLRIAAYSASFILNAVRQSTEELLAWPQTLADGTWLTRPELDDARNALERD